MDPTEKITVRLSPDTIILLQELVDRGEYGSLSESVSDAIGKLIVSKFAPTEAAEIRKEHERKKPLKMESLLSDEEPDSMDEAVKKAIKDFVKTRMGPEE